MSRRSRFILATAVLSALPRMALSQISLTGANPTLIENFDSIGTGAAATLPAGWRVDSRLMTTAYNAAGPSVTRTGGVVVGSNQLNSSSFPGTYNLSSTTADFGVDRAVGWLTNSTYTGPRNLFGAFANNTGRTITSLSLHYDIELYRGGTHDNSIVLYYGSDGLTWTSAAATVIANGTANTSTLFNPPATTNVVVALNNVNIANTSNVYLRFQYSSPTGFSTSEVLGIDNVTLSAATAAVGSTAVMWNPSLAQGASDGAGVWNASAATWWSPANQATSAWNDQLPNDAVFGAGAGSGSATVTLPANRTAGSLTFTANSPIYTLTGASLTISTGVTANQNAVIASNLAFAGPAGVSVAAAATLTFAGTIAASASITKTGPGTLLLNHTTLAALTISAGTVRAADAPGAAIVASALSVGDNTSATAAKLDLNNEDLILTSGTIDTIRILLKSGRNSGIWNGNGICSSSAQNDPAGLHALGYGLAASIGLTQLDGVPLPVSSIVIKYTTLGDCSLDGKVDLGNDFNLFLQGFLLLAPAGSSGWQFGDFDYNGSTDPADFQFFTAGYLSTGNSPASLEAIVASNPQLSFAQRAQFLDLIPEPSSIALLAAAIPSFCRRSRRKIIRRDGSSC